MERDQEQANVAFSDMRLDDEHSTSFAAEFALHVDDQESVRNEWCLDSGSSKHITYDKDDLVNYNKFRFPVDVRLADKRVVKAYGFGNTELHLQDENGRLIPVAFKRVLFVPELKKKLISISTITERGGEVLFKKEVCILHYQEKRILFGRRVGNLFEMQYHQIVPDFVSRDTDQLKESSDVNEH